MCCRLIIAFTFAIMKLNLLAIGWWCQRQNIQHNTYIHPHSRKSQHLTAYKWWEKEWANHPNLSGEPIGNIYVRTEARTKWTFCYGSRYGANTLETRLCLMFVRKWAKSINACVLPRHISHKFCSPQSGADKKSKNTKVCTVEYTNKHRGKSRCPAT